MTKDLAQTLAQRVQRIKPSPTLAVSSRANELRAAGKSIINLGVGEPDFDTPMHIKKAAIQAIKEGHTKYTPVDGMKSLKEAVIRKFANENKLHYELNQIIVSCGAKHSIYNALASVLNAGDEVLIPAPYWVSYPDIVKLLDGEPVILKADLNQNLKITPAQLAANITKKTRVLILNSPSNPAGVAYKPEELKALGEVLSDYPDVLVITDDIYEHTQWNHLPFTNILNACPQLYDRCLVINGVSKAYAMTGWRIGYTAGPSKIIAAMKKIQSQSTSNPASISQYAAQAALDGDQKCVQKMAKAFKERHDYFVKALQEIEGFECMPSDGTFYTFPSITGCYQQFGVTNDIEFAEFLLEKAGIAGVPGSAFGSPGHIRFSFATSMDNLKDAVERIRKCHAECS